MRLGFLLVAAPLVVPQERQEPSVEEVIAALIKKTNALESFHAIYDLEDKQESEETRMTLELIYRAPDLGRLRVSDSKGEHDVWVTSERMYSSDGDAWRTATIESVPAANLLYERFPETEQAVKGGVCLAMDMAITNAREPKVQLVFLSSPWGRPCVLGWLQMLQRRTGVKLLASALEWEDEGLRCRVSRETGLLEEASSASEKGRTQVRLREGRIDCDLASELVSLPDAARNAQVDADLERKLAFNPNYWRRIAVLHVESSVASGKRGWSELVRNDWHEVMDALHRQAIVNSYEKTLAGQRAKIDTAAEEAREDLEKDRTVEHVAEVEKRAAEARSKIEGAFASYEARYVDSLPGIDSDRYEPRQELFDTEKAVIDELWKELILDPLLAFYDEKISAALGK
jgi:hypothetical protein